MLEVAPGTKIYWETCGSPDGKPAVVVHGGPGSGCTPGHRRGFDPAVYRIVLIDQRNCGRSTPHAGDPATDLTGNTTQNLVADMERVREHLGVDRWLVLGGSWGSTLALAYAEALPARVSEMILTGVTTGRRSGSRLAVPRRRLAPLPRPVGTPVRCSAAGAAHRRRGGGLPAAAVRSGPRGPRQAAFEWSMWESATPDWPPVEGLAERFPDPVFALGFARLVTHYIAHDEFLEDGVLLRNIDRLAGIPAVLVNGRYDLQAPIGNAWELHRPGRARSW